jgi:uncharacterized short protein YbdD (DUF466 family)
MKGSLLKAGRGIRWYLRQATGEAKWDEYLDRARNEGAEPMTRRTFERQRAERKEHTPQSRCC